MIRYFFIVCLASFSCSAQQNLKPDFIGEPLHFSPQAEVEYNLLIEECEGFWRNITEPINEQKITTEDKRLYKKCAGDFKEYWSVLDIGCNWYCGGGQDSLSASSALKPYGEINYNAANAHDLNYKTAWIEGAEGYGIGEKLTYHVKPTNPRITKIIIVNGYVKSDKTWRNNSRVKTLNMLVNNRAYAILHLTDTKGEQEFTVQPLGNSNRGEAIELQPEWTITFEIADIYKGEKYDDTAITEIYFDGIDVH